MPSDATSPYNPLLRKCHLLLVEDERLIREILIRMLKRIGITEIVEASSAEMGWEYLAGDKSRGFHVIITDLTLPGVSGGAFIKQLRKLPNDRARTIPVIVLTGDSTVESFKTLKDCNIAGYLIKPISTDLLATTIERAIGLKPRTTDVKDESAPEAHPQQTPEPKRPTAPIASQFC